MSCSKEGIAKPSAEAVAGSRLRYEGTAVDFFAAVFITFMRSRTSSRMAKTLGASQAQADLIVPQKLAVQALFGAQPIGSFKKTTVVQGSQLAEAEKREEDPKWADALPLESVHEWVRKNDLRIRCMCRHVAQALGKRPQPGWVQLLGLKGVTLDAKVKVVVDAS